MKKILKSIIKSIIKSSIKLLVFAISLAMLIALFYEPEEVNFIEIMIKTSSLAYFYHLQKFYELYNEIKNK